MSYPSIGMPGMVEDDKWTPDCIRDLLISGTTIFDDEEGVYFQFNKENKKFEAVYDVPQENRQVWSFDTFIELATWVAFMGKTYL